MSNDIARRGLMLVLSSPSGAGKSTLSRRLLASDAAVSMSISATTRAPRVGEEEGKDYFFVSPDLRDKVRAAEIHADVMGSDHCPISLTLDL